MISAALYSFPYSPFGLWFQFSIMSLLVTFLKDFDVLLTSLLGLEFSQPWSGSEQAEHNLSVLCIGHQLLLGPCMCVP